MLWACLHSTGSPAVFEAVSSFSGKVEKGNIALSGDAQDRRWRELLPLLCTRDLFPKQQKEMTKMGALQGLVSCEGLDKTVAVSQWPLLTSLPFHSAQQDQSHGSHWSHWAACFVTGHSHLSGVWYTMQEKTAYSQKLCITDYETAQRTPGTGQTSPYHPN